ncbi:MAG: pyruvate kinase [Chloroflexi bacterium RBG_13_48_17]|nr:MAG: pyruvate kinase [Chloroflexi bacterium RBG_13_48_17]
MSFDITYNPYRRTKIVCTIGPNTSSASMIKKLLQAGMDVARINFSHGTRKEHTSYIKTLRQAAKQAGVPLAIMQDLPGPKNRTGKLKKGSIELKENADIILTTKEILGDEHRVSIDLPYLPSIVKPGDTIFLDDGAIELKVSAINKTEVSCQVVTGGKLGEDNGINIPGINWDTPVTNEEDRDHLLFGLKHDVDFIALSFVREADDVIKVKNFLRKRKKTTALIAKIERSEALNNLDEILEAADGAMVARGDLGIEIPIQRVPIVQKEIIRKCNHLGKPVIVATQILESMVNAPRPTRAEVTDVANAIFDGADALMLSEETAIGSYPVEAVEMMSQIALEAEAALPYEEIMINKGKYLQPQTDDAISYAACHTAHQLGAAAIIAFTSSGSTARRVAKYRPKMPILAITPSQVTQRQLSLSWGVRAFQIPEPSKIAMLFTRGARVAKRTGLAKDGDLVVITGGVPIGISGSTNLLKVEKIK